MMTAYASTETAVEALRLGASDYVEKPPNLQSELRMRVRKELERKRLQQENVLLKRALQTSHQFSNIIGSSEPDAGGVPAGRDDRADQQHGAHHRRVRHRQGAGRARDPRQLAAQGPAVRRASTAARCRRRCSTRSSSATCAARSPAPTRNKKGLIEVAEKGTIFLDEIGEMSPIVQVKLLRVLQERKFRRARRHRGGRRRHPDHRRHQPRPGEDGGGGQFREDLFYRINVIPLRLPPLRERLDDIPLLAEHFVAKFAEQMGKPITGISGAALARLQEYAWPGNIRELENAMERAVALERTPTDPARQPARAAAGRRAARPRPAVEAVPDDFPEAGFDLEQHVQDIEREYIAEALRRAGGVKVKAAELLGMSFRSFRYYTKKYNLK